MKLKKKNSVQAHDSHDDNNGDSTILMEKSILKSQFGRRKGYEKCANKRELEMDNHNISISDKRPLKKKMKFADSVTVDEIDKLRESEVLFHSNLFRMQTNEMLKEIRVGEKKQNFIKKWVSNFNEFLSSLKSTEIEDLTKVEWIKHSDLKIPLNCNTCDNEKKKLYYFQFLKPNQKSYILGSYKNEAIDNRLVIDLCIVMPSKCFQKEDFLNFVYDKKRALYLTFMAWKMKESSQISNENEIKFNYYKNNPCKPVIEIFPLKKTGEKFVFRIFASPEENTFKLNRYVPWNNNIRCNLSDKDNENALCATPNYNANVLFDLTMQKNQEFLEKIFGENQNLQEALVLMKIWSKQRNLSIGYSGFGNFIISMWIAYLFKSKKLHKTMSSYQIIRNTWNHLAISSWNTINEGITLCDGNSISNQPTLEQFHSYYDVVFVDITGFLNICANISLDLYLKIKLEAQQAINLLNDKQCNSFQLLFITKIPFYVGYDHILKICDQNLINTVVKQYSELKENLNFAEPWYPIFLKRVTGILRKGLSDRIISMSPIEISETKPWNITQAPKEIEKSFYLGFVLNHCKAFDMVDKGPPAYDESSSEEFRSFWGKKSSLRRFKDGTITEACVWASNKEILSQKRHIVQRIITYLLNYHLNINVRKLQFFGSEFDKVCELSDEYYTLIIKNRNDIIDAESTTLSVIKTFDELGRNLRDLCSLSLNIASVQGISPVFRYCDPIPTLLNGNTSLDGKKIVFQSHKIIDGIIQLGLSNKWPSDNLAALRRLKTAFHITIAEELKKKYKYHTRGSIEGFYILKNGYVFRIQIVHPKEFILMKSKIINKGIVQYVDTDKSLELEKRFNLIPIITNILHGLNQNFPSFGPAVMISKRWLYSQMIDNYLWSDECTELIIAYIYSKSSIYKNPFQPQIGFFRFLNILANTDWRSEMILLNFNDEMKENEIGNIERRFLTKRDSFPPLTIITSYDREYLGIWTKNSPNAHILAHVTILARFALKSIETKYLTSTCQSIDVSDLFTPNLEGYDAIIHLRDKHVLTPLVFNFDVKKSKNSKQDCNSSVPKAGYNPIKQGLSKLREAYCEFAIFFYNPCNEYCIGVIWKPSVFDEKEFNVTSTNCRVTDVNKSTNEKLICNRKQLIEDFKITLEDLYYSVKIIEQKP